MWLARIIKTEIDNEVETQRERVEILAVIFQSLSHVWVFAAPWTAGCQAFLSLIISWSLFKLISIETVMPSNHLILCYPPFLPSIFPSIRVLSNESALHLRCQSIGASASVLPVNIQGWFPLGSTGFICSLRDSQESSSTPQFESINSFVLCLLYGPTLISVHDYWRNHSFNYALPLFTEVLLDST